MLWAFAPAAPPHLWGDEGLLYAAPTPDHQPTTHPGRVAHCNSPRPLPSPTASDRLWALGSGLWALGSGLWALGSGLWALGSGLWALGSGLWALGSGLWALGSGLWALGSGLWALGSGLWALGSGLWALGSGLWALGSGLWANHPPLTDRVEPHLLPPTEVVRRPHVCFRLTNLLDRDARRYSLKPETARAAKKLGATARRPANIPGPRSGDHKGHPRRQDCAGTRRHTDVRVARKAAPLGAASMAARTGWAVRPPRTPPTHSRSRSRRQSCVTQSFRGHKIRHVTPR
ncbi:hypothetical protein JOD51_000570 [Curtobacterium herbarum]|nr:hypothetical protein [Curtobacterium herbarum]